jgi:hydrophobe/amphiphile efflux-3 (HAE3) family protein
LLSIVRFVLDRPRLIIGLLLAATVVFASYIPGIRFDADIEHMMPEDDPAIIDIRDATAEFGSQDVFMVAIRGDNAFSAETLKKLSDMTDDILEIDGVESVVTPLTINLIESGFFGIEISPAADGLPQTQAEIQEFRERILSSSYVGQLVSEDGRAAAIMVKMESTDDLASSRTSEITGKIDEVVQRYRGPEEIYIVGGAYTNYYTEQAMVSDIKLLLPLVIVVVVAVLYWSFRSMRGVVLPLAVVLTSAIWGVGLMSILDVPLTIVTMIMPVILVAIGSANGIHILNRYYEELASGKDKRAALEVTVVETSSPIAMAALTTAAGFGSLITSFVRPVREFGLFTAFGVLVALVFSLSFIPAALVLQPVPAHIATDKPDRKGWLGRGLSKLGTFVVRHSRAVVLASVVILLVCIAGATSLSLESNMLNYFDKDSPLIMGTDIVEDEFGGSMQISLLFDTGRPDGVKEPEVLNRMIEAQRYMDSLPGVSQASSLADLIRELNQALNEGDPEFYTIPETREAVAQELLLFTMQGGSSLDSMVTYTFDKALVSARVANMSSRELKEVTQSLERYVRDNYSSSDDLKVKVVGLPNVMQVLMERFRTSQIYSLATSIVTVAIIVAIIMKSLVAGLVSVIPLVLTVGANFGVMGFGGIPLDAITTTIASVAVGIGVDYSVHYLSRYRFEIDNGRSQDEAIAVTGSTSGKGIVFNAVTLMAGFVILIFSNFRAIGVFGYLVALTMLTSLLAALTVVPAIMKLVPRTTLRRRSAGRLAEKRQL